MWKTAAGWAEDVAWLGAIVLAVPVALAVISLPIAAIVWFVYLLSGR